MSAIVGYAIRNSAGKLIDFIRAEEPFERAWSRDSGCTEHALVLQSEAEAEKAGIEARIDIEKNIAELLREDIEAFHMNLDACDIPREVGTERLSMWGRVCTLLDNRAKAPITRRISDLEARLRWQTDICEQAQDQRDESVARETKLLAELEALKADNARRVTAGENLEEAIAYTITAARAEERERCAKAAQAQVFRGPPDIDKWSYREGWWAGVAGSMEAIRALPETIIRSEKP